jgi:hypothetical protein
MLGIVLFIISEVFAFLSVFWAFFHSSLAPAIEIGGSWPPLGITPLDPFAIPLLNTFLLLSSGVSHKCEIFEFYFLILFSSVLPFNVSKVNSFNRIGPHNYDILSIIIGGLLGDGSMEKLSNGNGSRFVYYKTKKNGEYLLWLHKIINNLGYSDNNLPKMYAITGSDLIGFNEIKYYYRIRTFNFLSFN